MLDMYLKMILKAPVYDVARETPLDHLELISGRTQNQVWLKREDMQPVFSYKLRGAYTMMASLTPAERARGVVTASAGNHAQGVALAASRLGIRAVIVMPKTTPEIKINAVRRLNAEIILHGNTYDEASVHASEYVATHGMTYVPPYDHPLVIAGQGTVAMEILRQHRGTLYAIFVPVGGGGLIAGVAAFVKALEPSIKIIGVEADEAACMQRALAAGERVVLDKIGIFADGAAVRQVGAEPFRIAQRYVDEVLTVTIDEICAAVKDIFEDTRSIAEPAGALALAGLKQYVVTTGAALFQADFARLITVILEIFILIELFRIALAYMTHRNVLPTVFEAALVAVARKFVIFETSSNTLQNAAGLALLLLAVAVSWWLLARINATDHGGPLDD